MLMDRIEFDPILEVVSISAIDKNEARQAAEQNKRKLRRALASLYETDDYTVSLGAPPNSQDDEQQSDLDDPDDPDIEQREQPTEDLFATYMHDPSNT